MDLQRRVDELERRMRRLEGLLVEAPRLGDGSSLDSRDLEPQEPPTMLGHHDGNGNGGTASPAGVAAADAWLPEGPGVRHADRWVEGDPRDLAGHPARQALWRERVAGAVGTRRCAPDEGLRLRFVLSGESLSEPGLDLLRLALPILEVLDPVAPRFVHLEVMRGPEKGLHIAFDNRMPAVLTQYRLPQDGDGGLPTLVQVPAASPIHVNLVLHDGRLDPAAFGPGGAVPRALSSLEGVMEGAAGSVSPRRVHQLTVMAGAEAGGGCSLGVEAVHDEQGSVGGQPAVTPHASRGDRQG